MKFVSVSDIGKARDNNEDFLVVLEDLNVFIVCDGMGGHQAGEVAAEIAAQTIAEGIRKLESFDFMKDIDAILESANGSIISHAKDNLATQNMGTTVVVGYIKENKLYIANVGDSRCYILGQDGIRQVSRDHSLVAELVKIGSISEAEAENHPDRNIITSALGIDDTFEMFKDEVTLGTSQYVLLCTDGLTNMVSSDEILSIFKSSSIEQVAQLLVDKANEYGGQDNISVVCIEL